jgi:hypothetical protein
VNATTKQARLDASIRRRWERIDWEAGVPRDALVLPEAHYLDLSRLRLTRDQRLALNRLMTCFTCELFVHFEGYVINYLERHGDRVPQLSPAVVTRFVAEERLHSEMFRRLLNELEPDLYPRGALRFLRWSTADDLALRLAPAGTFFLLTWFFEEITLCMPEILAAHPAEAAPLVAQVMTLHAEDEEPHVAIDERVLDAPSHTDAALALPLLYYVDAVVRRAWRKLVAFAAKEIALDEAQCAALRDRGPSLSDRIGMERFNDKLARKSIAPVLQWVLRRELRKHA